MVFSRRQQQYFISNNVEAHCSIHLFTDWMGQNHKKFVEHLLENERYETEIATELMFLDLQ